MLLTCEDESTTRELHQKIFSRQLGGHLLLKVLNVGQVLEFIAELEAEMDPEIKVIPNEVIVEKIPQNFSELQIYRAFESFGAFEDVKREKKERCTVNTRFLWEAVAASLFKDGTVQFGIQLNVKLAKNAKTCHAMKLAAERNFLLWA